MKYIFIRLKNPISKIGRERINPSFLWDGFLLNLEKETAYFKNLFFEQMRRNLNEYKNKNK